MLWLSLWMCVWPAAIISLQFVSGSRSALIWYDTTAPDPVIAWRVPMLRQRPVMYPYSHPLSIMSPVWWCTSTMCYCLCFHISRQQQNVTRPLCPHWQLSWAALAPGIVSYFYITLFRYRYKQRLGIICDDKHHLLMTLSLFPLLYFIQGSVIAYIFESCNSTKSQISTQMPNVKVRQLESRYKTKHGSSSALHPA